MKVNFVTSHPVGRSIVGIDTYATELYRQLENEEEVDIENIQVGTGLSGTWKKMKLALSKSEGIFHGINPGCSPGLGIGRRKNSVVTFHDPMIAQRFREEGRIERLRNRFYLEASKRADRIIAVSRDTKEYIVEHLGVDKGKVTVIHHGVDHERFYPGESGSEKLRIGYLGRMLGYKNVERLIEAYSELETDRETELVLGGRANTEKVAEIAEEYGVKPEFTGAIEEEELPDFYRSLDIFVFPSLCEGFGLPVLEAMASGLPVAVTDRSSVPEVAGDAGLYFDPENTEEIEKRVEELVESQDFRESVGKKCLERSRKFTWEKTAEETLEVYRDLEDSS